MKRQTFNVLFFIRRTRALKSGENPIMSRTSIELDIPLQLWEKYNDHPYCQKKGVLLPVMRNQKCNSYSKEIADSCGIKKNLTTHCGRHTFLTVVALANNVSLENVSKMLGHTNTKMTQLYAKV